MRAWLFFSKRVRSTETSLSVRKKRWNRATNINLPGGIDGGDELCGDSKGSRNETRNEFLSPTKKRYERINGRNWPFKDFETGSETIGILSTNWGRWWGRPTGRDLKHLHSLGAGATAAEWGIRVWSRFIGTILTRANTLGKLQHGMEQLIPPELCRSGWNGSRSSDSLCQLTGFCCCEARWICRKWLFLINANVSSFCISKIITANFSANCCSCSYVDTTSFMEWTYWNIDHINKESCDNDKVYVCYLNYNLFVAILPRLK